MQTRPAVGASGAIFGLMGAAIIFFFRYGTFFHARNRRIGAALFGWGSFQLALGVMTPYVDNWAHFGGLLCGLLLGAFLPSAIFERPEEEQAS